MHEVAWIAALSVLLHGLLIGYGRHQDATSRVKYTDIDYHVFSDAARCVLDGGSPFDRATYRYTPMVAWILCPGAALGGAALDLWGKVVFSVFDMVVGCIAYKIVELQQEGAGRRSALVAAAAWLLNPMVLVVSTRGNAESLIAALVITSVYCALKRWPGRAGLVFGLAVHFKIYPVIYAAPLYFSFGHQEKPGQAGHQSKSGQDGRQKQVGRLGRRLEDLFLPNAARLRFTWVSICAFALPTLGFYVLYGQQYMDEAFLYHVRRSDIKHNFSPYFYLMHLTADHERAARWLSLAAFAPQALAVAWIALGYSGARHLPFCMFLQTFAFVTFNKVCTSQYFLWYLCLLPAVLPRLKPRRPRQILAVVGAWLSTQAAWLWAAYLFEFEGRDTLVYVWLASLCFFAANIYGMDFFIRSYTG